MKYLPEIMTDENVTEQQNETRILFVSHDASRSGAPILLLNTLSWLKNNTDIVFEVLLRNEGELKSDFAELCQIHSFFEDIQSIPENPVPSLLEKVLYQFKLRQRPQSYEERVLNLQKEYQIRLVETFESKRFSLIYSNTIVNGDVLEVLAPLCLPVISHVHELEDVIQIFSEFFPSVLKYTDHFIAASRAVKTNLVENHHIDSEAISVVHEYVPANASSISRSDRNSLGLPADRFLVCACGKGEWRKGPDLFVLLAERICRSFGRERFHFCWIGGWVSEQDERRTMALVQKLELNEIVTFTGVVKETQPYFSVCDAFAMVSREDPFPIVCLEAASCGLPILCFQKAGGMPEFVEEDAGFVVPFCDIQIMAERIHELSLNPELKETLGSRARAKVLQHYTADVGVKRILNIISRLAQTNI